VASVHPGDFAFVYYSGHGVEVKGINYLLPVDLPADATADEVEDDAVSAQRIATELDDRGAAVKVIVLDACRDNPIKGSRSAGGGLAPMEGLGSLIVFATEAGKTASDNSASRNGLFTQYLLKALTAKDESLDDAIRDVARQMASDTNRRQVPAIYGLLERPVYLFTGPVTVNLNEPDPALEAWNAIKDTHNPQDFDDFVKTFPDSPYSASARLAANRLRRESSASSPPARSNNDETRFGAATTTATLVVSCDLACKWQVDGVDQGTIQPGDAARSLIAPGEHFLSATTADHVDRTSQTVTASAGTSKVVSLALRQVRENRIAAVKTVVDRGWAFYNKKDYTQAFPAFKEACNANDASSCTEIGYLYSAGLGVPQDESKSAAFSKQGCDLGNMAGCRDLGVAYENGQGATKDYSKAMALFKQACDGGDFSGCNGLGWLYLNAQGTAQNYPLALSLFRQACDGNIAIGCANLGDMYRFGQSVPVDLDKTRQYYDQACKGGREQACTALKAINDDAGSGKPANSQPKSNATTNSTAAKAAADRAWSFYKQKDYSQALPAFQEACTGKIADGCTMAGYLLQNGLGKNADHKKAFDLFKLGCDLGDAWGCSDLGFMFEKGQVVTLNYSRALALYKQACDGGALSGCSNLGYMYENSEGVAQDYPLAMALFKQACDGNEMLGCDNLGTIYQYGRSVPIDLERARQLYDQACKGGNDFGCRDLKALDTN